MTGARFYVELPADDQGNVALPHAVMEGRMVPHDVPGRVRFLIVAPPEVVPWSGYRADMWGGYAEVEGPARMLTREEHAALIKGLEPVTLADLTAEGEGGS